MRKYFNMKYVLMFLVCAFIMTPIVGAVYGYYSCRAAREVYEDGYFLYSVDSSERLYVVGLTADGQEQKNIVLPRMIAGREVYRIGYMSWGYHGVLNSKKLEKVFFPYDVEVVIKFEDCPHLGKFIIIPIETQRYFDSHYAVKNYVPSLNADQVTDGTNYVGNDRYMGNVSYMYNYEGAPNAGYYWIDDYDYGEIIDWQPYLPERDGYRFTGWYKEPACVNKWNFEKDTLPAAKLTEKETPPLDEPAAVEKEKVFYQETRLYAKWTK